MSILSAIDLISDTKGNCVGSHKVTLSNDPSDRVQAEPMTKVVRANTGRMPRDVSRWRVLPQSAVDNPAKQGVDVYMPPDRCARGASHRQHLVVEYQRISLQQT